MIILRVVIADDQPMMRAGFLLKDAPTREVVAAVRAVAAGDAVLSATVTRQLLDQVARRLPAAVSRDPNALASLTEREQEVLQCPRPFTRRRMRRS